MTLTSASSPGVASPDHVVLRSGPPTLAGAGGDSRFHAEPDLRIVLAWCTNQVLEPSMLTGLGIVLWMWWMIVAGGIASTVACSGTLLEYHTGARRTASS